MQITLLTIEQATLSSAGAYLQRNLNIGDLYVYIQQNFKMLS